LEAQWIRDLDNPDISDNNHIEGWMVSKWMKEGIYPDVTGIELGDVIVKCWKGQFRSAREAAQSIQHEIALLTLDSAGQDHS